MAKMRASRGNTLGFSLIAIAICTLAFCSSLISYRVSMVIFAAGFILAVILAIRSGRVVNLNIKAWTTLLPWMIAGTIAVGSFVVGRGYDFAATAAFAICVLFLLFSVENTKWIEPVIKIFLAVLLLFALVTIVSYIYPNFYSSFIKPTFYADVPMAQDYRSGLASHYSHNGTFCTVGLIIASSLMLYSKNRRSKGGVYGLLASIFLIALILTTKRAHLLCGVFAIGVIYLASGNRHRILKAIGIACLAIILVVVLMPVVPGLEATIDRLIFTFSSKTSFEDNINNRGELWQFAVNGFMESPLFGHGWTSYCYRWPDGTTVSYIAHNEFLNLLYEVGFLGAAVVLLGCTSSFILTLRTISMAKSVNDRALLRLSLCLQLFFLCYAFTSGALFTTIPNFISYFFAVAIMASIRWQYSKDASLTSMVSGG